MEEPKDLKLYISDTTFTNNRSRLQYILDLLGIREIVKEEVPKGTFNKNLYLSNFDISFIKHHSNTIGIELINFLKGIDMVIEGQIEIEEYGFRLYFDNEFNREFNKWMQEVSISWSERNEGTPIFINSQFRSDCSILKQDQKL